MAGRAANDQPRIGGSQIIWVRKGQVQGDGAFAEYMRRAIENWPFAKEELQDFGVAAENGDWPALVKGDAAAGPDRSGPCLCNAKNDHFWNVLFPVGVRPQFDAGFPGVRKRSLELAKSRPWKSRKDIAAWRGNLGCTVGCGPRGHAYFPDNHFEHCKDDSPHWNPDEVGFVYGCGEKNGTRDGAWMKHYRVQLVRQTEMCGKECGLNAMFPDIGGEHRPFIESYVGSNISRWCGGFMHDEDTADHRYVFHVGNNGYSDRSWRMFALGGTVLLVDNGWREWYYSLLNPFVHYIPIRADASDVCEKLQWARAHPEEAQAIAERGLAVVERCFDVHLVDLYVAEMIRQLGQLWALGLRRQHGGL